MRRAALVQRGMPSRGGGGSEIRWAARALGGVRRGNIRRGGFVGFLLVWVVIVCFVMEGVLYFGFRGEN